MKKLRPSNIAISDHVDCMTIKKVYLNKGIIENIRVSRSWKNGEHGEMGKGKRYWPNTGHHSSEAKSNYGLHHGNAHGPADSQSLAL